MQCSSDLNQFINEQIDLLDKCIFFESHTEASIQTEILQCYTENTEANLTDIEYTNMVSIIREEYCKRKDIICTIKADLINGLIKEEAIQKVVLCNATGVKYEAFRYTDKEKFDQAFIEIRNQLMPKYLQQQQEKQSINQNQKQDLNQNQQNQKQEAIGNTTFIPPKYQNIKNQQQQKTLQDITLPPKQKQNFQKNLEQYADKLEQNKNNIALFDDSPNVTQSLLGDKGDKGGKGGKGSFFK